MNASPAPAPTRLEVDCAKVVIYLLNHDDSADTKIIKDCDLSNSAWLRVRHALLSSNTIASIGNGKARKYLLLTKTNF